MAKEFQVVMLASGSKGNAALISTDSQRFLVDIGLSCRELCRRLRLLGVQPEELEGVFITHEHIDHVKGLVTFAKKYETPIFVNWPTACVLYKKFSALARNRLTPMDGRRSFDDVTVFPFALSHDAMLPQGYCFQWHPNVAKMTYVTDTGFVTPEVRQAAEGSDVIVLEANHDLEMLQKGPYPMELKKRIMSTQGHLSNLTAGQFLLQLPKLPKKVILAHLSEENNRPELALDTVRGILAEKEGFSDTEFYVAQQHEAVAAFPMEQMRLFEQLD